MNMNDKKEDDALGSFYMGRMRPPPEPRRVLPKGVLSGLTLVAFAAILWYAYPQGQEKYTDIDIPTIKADTGIYKFQPDDPGGVEVRHQDSTLFNPLDKVAEEKIERLLPTPEEPMKKEEALKTAAPIEKEKPQLNLASHMEEIAKGTERVVVPEAKVSEMPSPKPVEKKAAPSKAVDTPPPASGVYIQLGSYRDPSGAKTDWAKLQKKFPRELSGLSMTAERVDLGSKGVWHRLYAGRVSAGQAADICAVLKSQNPGGCFVVRK